MVVLLKTGAHHPKCPDGRNVNRMEVVEVDIAVEEEVVVSEEAEVAASKVVGIKVGIRGIKIRSHSGVEEEDIKFLSQSVCETSFLWSKIQCITTVGIDLFI